MPVDPKRPGGPRRGPVRPTTPDRADPTAARATPRPVQAPPLPPAKGPLDSDPGPGQQGARQEAEGLLLGEGRIGDETVTAADLAKMGSLVAARHLMTLLAKKRQSQARETVLAEVGDFLLGLSDVALLRRLLLQMVDAGRIVDIYPLEVLDYVLERQPSALKDIEYGPVILNKDALHGRVFAVEEVVRIKVPLSLKMRAFALAGGGSPGYCFAPGPPGEYHLELGDAGTYTVLVRGDVRKKSYVDRVTLRFDDPPAKE